MKQGAKKASDEAVGDIGLALWLGPILEDDAATASSRSKVYKEVENVVEVTAGLFNPLFIWLYTSVRQIL